MDSAIDIENGEIVDAEMLRLIINVHHKKFVCRGCGCPVVPASFRPENKVRPYFRVLDNHIENCDIDGYEKYIEIGKNQSISVDGKLPISYPNKVFFKDFREVVYSNVTTVDPKVFKGNYNGSNHNINKARKNYTVSSIRPICRFYIQFPHDRDMPLSIPCIDANKYRFAFKLINAKYSLEYNTPRVFYAPIRWDAEPIESDEYFEVFLNTGVWNETENKYNPMFKVRVHWENWSIYKKNYVKKDIEYLRDEIKESKQKKAFIFFIGEQDAEEKFIFNVFDHQKICCLLGNS